jgi:hypothetical protein
MGMSIVHLILLMQTHTERERDDGVDAQQPDDGDATPGPAAAAGGVARVKRVAAFVAELWGGVGLTSFTSIHPPKTTQRITQHGEKNHAAR